MIAASAVFGSAGTVSVFGFNMFICESSDYETVPGGSAVIATSCAPYDLIEGNLVLYSTDPADRDAPLAMGYYTGFELNDGVYYLSLENGGQSTVISENELIGKAGWSSAFLGQFITFTKSPWGVLLMAVLPCALLVLLDLLRSGNSEPSEPEIVPQIKNQDMERPKPQISVGESGDALYRRNPAGKQSSADSVLFTYNSKKPAGQKPSAPTMTEADVLSLLNSPIAKPEQTEKPATAEQKEKSPVEAAAQTSPKPVLPAPVAAKRYIDNTVAPASKQEQEETAVKTAPDKPKKTKRGDAFFAQSDAPQIGKGLTGRQTRSIIDLEDALATVQPRSSRQDAGRRSADILASKNRRELITDDDDSRDKSRYEVDDILNGINRRYSK